MLFNKVFAVILAGAANGPYLYGNKDSARRPE